MDIISLSIVFLIGILISVIFNHFFPRLTLPLIQIIIGTLIGFSPYGKHIGLEPELIMVMIVAPLLFNEAKKTRTSLLFQKSFDILVFSFPIVIITVCLLGLFFDNVLSSIPMAACFALAAALAPTDLITVTSVAKKMKMPEDSKIILEGEGLFNDASGITTFQIAVLALVSGNFSVISSVKTLLFISIGGVLIGIALQAIKKKITTEVRKNGIEDTKFYIIFDILTPFLAYVVAEKFGVSGVLAVVTIGLIETMSIKRSSLFDAKLKNLSDSTWDVLSTILNAVVFIYLGAQLPRILEDVDIASYDRALVLIAIILVATLVLFLIRFALLCLYNINKARHKTFNIKDQIIMTLSGVKGTVTLATITTLPFTLSNGEIFVDRSLMIFIASGVIVSSMLISIILLPIFLETKEEDNTLNLEIYITQRTIDLLKEEINDENQKEMDAVLKVYNNRIKKLRIDNSVLSFHEQRKLDRLILKKTIEIERRELKRLLENEYIDTKMYVTYLRMLRRFMQRTGGLFSLRFILGFIIIRVVLTFSKKENEKIPDDIYEGLKEIFIHNHYQVILMINENINEKNESYLRVKIKDEKRLIRMIENDEFLNVNQVHINPNYTKEMEKGFQIERNIIQNLYENGIINFDKSLELKQNVNLMEEYYMNDTNNNLAYYFLRNVIRKS